jgi:hypothetical protein
MANAEAFFVTLNISHNAESYASHCFDSLYTYNPGATRIY